VCHKLIITNSTNSRWEDAYTLKEFIKSLAGAKAPGPNTTFTVFHIVYALELMSDKTIGRNKLAEKLNVGEGAIRTIINRLIEAGLISTSKAGCTLTNKGLRTWREFEEAFPKRVEIGKNEVANSDFNFAFLVKNAGHKVTSGIDQRDAAIVAGARKAIVIVAKQGRLCIESVSEDIGKQFPKATSQILNQLKPEDNDVVVIAGAETLLKAKRGAFAAAWSLLENSKKKQ
jgi:DNA-binding MarR family transcriptional regulator